MPNLICIVCPKGCHLQVTLENGEYIVTGNSCLRGKTYGISEVTNPTRMVTSTVRINNGTINRLPVKTSNPIPKSCIFKVIAEINKTVVNAPVKVNDVIIKNVCGTNVDIIATRNIEAKS